VQVANTTKHIPLHKGHPKELSRARSHPHCQSGAQVQGKAQAIQLRRITHSRTKHTDVRPSAGPNNTRQRASQHRQQLQERKSHQTCPTYQVNTGTRLAAWTALQNTGPLG